MTVTTLEVWDVRTNETAGTKNEPHLTASGLDRFVRSAANVLRGRRTWNAGPPHIPVIPDLQVQVRPARMIRAGARITAAGVEALVRAATS